MPPTIDTDRRLADYEQRYRELAAELATIGLIHSGSVTRRYTRCATPGCKCHADPPQPHGPYYQWTAVSRVKFLGGIGLLMVCGRCHKRVSSGAGQVVKRCALGPLGRPLGDKPDRLPLAGSEVPGQGPVT